MSGPVAPRALFLCDGAAAPSELEVNGWGTPHVISTRGRDPELTLVLEGLARKVAGEIHPRAWDLARIAACCYAADLRVPKSGGTDVHRTRWRRELAIVVPVAEPAFWSDEDVGARLEEALGFATEDAWTIRFVQGRADEHQLRITWAEQGLVSPPTAVILFSGGTDSLCALVEALHRGENPVVVSHWPARHIRSRQDTLFAGVKARFQKWDVPHASFEIHRRGKGQVEASQRTRGFLYACLGAALADHYGTGEVRLADNGYVSVNPPISDQLIGALASRSTHPKFLHLVNGLLALVFPAGIRVTNPFWDRTRAQALEVLEEAGCAHLLASTYSCGKQQGHQAGRPLCGGCSQCVDRRVAVLAAGLEDHDPVSRYELDLFTGALREGEARTVALDYVRFAAGTRGLGPRALYARVPQLDDCLVPDDPDFAAREIGIARVLLDHAEETMRVVSAMAARLSDDLANRTLPPTSLLRLWIGPGSDPATTAGVGARAEITADTPAARFGLAVVDESSTFLRQGETWVVKFRGQIGHYKLSLGITQLTHLLENQGQELDVIALASCVASPHHRGPSPEGTTSWSSGLGPVQTPGGKKFLTERYAQLTEEINAARAEGRSDRVARLLEDRKLVRKLQQEAKGIGGRDREMAGPEERARKSVSGNIHGCYERMRHAIPLFVEHAEQFVRLGVPPYYRPDPPENWLIRR